MPKTPHWALTVLLALAAGCGHGDSRSPDQSSRSTGTGTLAAEDSADRIELVKPPPDFWRPESPEARLKLTLSAEKAQLRAGEMIRYRLELQNTGGRDVFFSEDPSFVKFGINHVEFHAYLTGPGQPERPLPPPFSLGGPKPSLESIRNRGSTKLELTLHSGETLISRPDQPAPNRFRDLKTLAVLRHPGRYRLRFVYDRAGDSRLRAESNVVEFEVVP